MIIFKKVIEGYWGLSIDNMLLKKEKLKYFWLYIVFIFFLMGFLDYFKRFIKNLFLEK